MTPALWDAYDASENDAAMLTNHSVTLTGLSGSSTYYFRVGSTDTSGNGPATSNEISFTTDPEPDVTAPQIISPPTVTIKTNQTATIVWATDEESNSQVQYDTQSHSWNAYPSSRNNADMLTSHSVTLTNLTGDTLYYFTVGSTDATGNGPTTSTEITFTTESDPDTTPPQFTSPPTVTSKTNNSAVIAWSTDEPGNSQVQYGTTSNVWGSYSASENDGEFVTFHTVTLVGLNGDTRHYFRAGSTDAAGNGPLPSNEITFRTNPDPDIDAPRITSPPTVTDKTESYATIAWETDEPSNSEVRYDTSSLEWDDVSIYRKRQRDGDLSQCHHHRAGSDIRLRGRRVQHLFHGRIHRCRRQRAGPRCFGQQQPLFSEDSFVTELEADEKAPKILSGPSVTAIDAGTAIIEWETDEPANSMVQYDTASATWGTYTFSENDGALVTQHSVSVTGLLASTLYYFSIGSTDADGNGPLVNQDVTNPSGESTFTTTDTVDDTAPEVSNVSVAWVTNKTALITWQTDEPGNSQVRYGLSPATWEIYTGSENDPDMVVEPQPDRHRSAATDALLLPGGVHGCQGQRP